MSSEMQRLTHGEWIALPSTPKLVRGQADEANALRWRGYRGSYDWKSYSPEQLPVMEAYWDACVRELQRLLPERFREDPSRVRGINLGTFNGAFQKAWMRLGYDMYGIEITDVIDELHEYGCAGERGNFFSLRHMSDGQFDFAIMDRAFFLKPLHAFFIDDKTGLYHQIGEQMPDGAGPALHHRGQGGVRFSLPPFFGEVFRVLKSDGAFAAIFYPFWSEIALRELYRHGEVRLHPVKRRHPYLGISVDRRRAPSRFPEIEDTIERTAVECPSEMVDHLTRDPTVSRVQVDHGRTIKFHHIPTNKFVIYCIAAKKVLEKRLIVNDPDIKQFFYGNGNFAIFPQKEYEYNKQTVVLLVDCKITGKLSEKNVFVREARNIARVIVHSGVDRGTLSLEAIWSDCLEFLNIHLESEACQIIFGHTLWDCSIKWRADKPRISLSQSLSWLRFMVENVRARGCRAYVLLPPQTDKRAEVPVQYQYLVEFRDALRQFADECGIGAIDLNDALALCNGASQESYMEIRQSQSFRRRVAFLIKKAMEQA